MYNLAKAQIDAFGVTPGDRILQVASLNFDASISEIAMALCAGATLVLAPTAALLPGDTLTQTLRRHSITHATIVPAALALLEPDSLPLLRTVISAGEACPAALAARWAHDRRLFNAYGPTETTVCATIMDCSRWQNRQQAPPIGRPIANAQAYILHQHGQPAPIGVPGELCVAGVGLARGYLNRPELTAEKFIPNPFGPGCLYKTGDLARWLPDGNIEFLGRIDHQVKLRGFRIELGEIEAVLCRHPAVQECAVLAREDTRGEKHVIAYVVLRDPGADLRSHLRNSLPDYMIPSTFVILEALPVTPNGKVDRKALPAPDFATLSSQAGFVAPRTPSEIALAAIWAQVLGIQSIGVHDNFFALGGHSLLATRVISHMRQTLGVEIALRSLFETPTVAGLSAQIDAELQRHGTLAAVEIPVADRSRPLPLSFAQQRALVHRTARCGCCLQHALCAAP